MNALAEAMARVTTFEDDSVRDVIARLARASAAC